MYETRVSDNQEENDNLIIRESFKITKLLFCSSEEFQLGNFVSEVKEYIEMNRINKETISNILGIFTIVRPKQQELLTKIENAISTTHSSMEYNFDRIFWKKLPYIFKLDTAQSPLLEFIKNDDFSSLQEFISNTIDFDFSQTYEIYSEYVNLIDIASYYGSIDCFKYFVVNNAPFSEYVCPFSICGSNYEIIHYLENNFREENFNDEICLKMSIAYHHYEITDYLNVNYNSSLIYQETAIYSFNYLYLSKYSKLDTKTYESVNELFLKASGSGNYPIFQYLCEISKVNKEATNEDGETALHKACEGGHLPIVQYLCEVAKVNTEATNKDGETALHIACFWNRLPIVQYLCEVAKVNTEATNEYGETALDIACERDQLPIVHYLCKVAKVNKEATDEYG